MRKAAIFSTIFLAASVVSSEASAASNSYFCKFLSSNYLRDKFNCTVVTVPKPTPPPVKPTPTPTPKPPTTTPTPKPPTTTPTPKPPTTTPTPTPKPPTTTPTPTTFSAKLSWTIPSTRQNGQPLQLSELSGYELYYTTDSSSSNGTVVTVSGGSKASYEISNLKAGTYYFAISAIDASGLKSPLSSMVSAKVGL